ncbi:MAG: hypothetical protein ACR2F5_00495 [Candidatus Limnocylindria bacterium]
MTVLPEVLDGATVRRLRRSVLSWYATERRDFRSDRAYRGAAMRLLAAEPVGALVESALREAVAGDAANGPAPLDDARWDRVLTGLERDGLVNRTKGMVALGAATIRS